MGSTILSLKLCRVKRSLSDKKKKIKTWI